jgi:two-component system, OmpR family, response regulator RegX3
MEDVLIIEDDEAHSRYAELVLTQHGYSVQISRTGAAGRQALANAPADVVLLETALPDTDGIELCKELRAATDAAIIFVSAHGDDMAKVLGLDAGADDFITKPFSATELTARMRAILRRQQRAARARDELLAAGEIVLELNAHRVVARGQELPVTPTEFRLLRALMTHAGRVVPRDEILETVWGPGYFGDTNVLDAHISGLRRKLRRVIKEADLVSTVRGVGYRFREPSAA